MSTPLVPRLALALGLAASAASAAQGPRARDLGVPFDGTPGPLNAITDVAGVEVGQVTLVSGGDAKRFYYLLGAAPLVLILGWWIWRRRREARKAAAPSSDR